MRAMVLEKSKSPLILRDVPRPEAGAGELLIKVSACAVCRTDLHIVDGELTEPKLPLIPGHQIVGRVEDIGGSAVSDEASRFRIGDRVGIPWLGWTDGDCVYCRAGRENLCDRARFTGYTIDGGYAEYTVVDERFCFPLPQKNNDLEIAPLLCAGLIGFRAYRKTGQARRLGLYGFGNAATLITQLAVFEGREIYAFTRPGDAENTEISALVRLRLGRWFGPGAAGKTGGGDHFCFGRFARANGAAASRERRNRCLRRDSHDRHPGISLP